LGGGLDEAPFAYKNIEEVMSSQKHLVEVVGKFTPKIVKMDGAAPRQRNRRNDHRGTLDAIVGE
jgi:tRNA-splicing ligase RtcB (3'-phosphate/5'-hydroxy nucleic acid ligase)